MKEITSRYLQDIGACQDAREQFRKELNGGHGLSVSRVFTRLKQVNRLDWANWLIVRLMTHEQQIRYAIYAAEQVINLYEERGKKISQRRDLNPGPADYELSEPL